MRGFDETHLDVAYWAELRPAPVTDSRKVRKVVRAEGGTLPFPSRQAHLDLANQPSRANVSLEAEVPEALFEGMREFINNHPQWDQYSVIASALACFLFQNGSTDRIVKDHYLAGLFSEP